MTEQPPHSSYLQDPVAPPAPSRKGAVIVLAVVGACLVLAAAIAIPLALTLRGGDDPEPVASGEVTLDDVVVHDDLPANHEEGRIDYDLRPPPGGVHNDRWMGCGVYEEEVPDELMVHSLEHGTVWITHDPDLPGEDIVILQEILPDDGIMSPYRDQAAPVVVTVWGRQLHLDGATDPRLELFIAEYGDGHTSLEPRVTCHGGLSLDQAREAVGGLRI